MIVVQQVLAFVKFIYYFVIAFIKGLVKSTYTITFEKEADNLWYVVFPGWPKKYHSNLQMVAGADKLLSYLLKAGTRRVTLSVKTAGDCPPDYFTLHQECKSITGGSWYKVNYKEFNRNIWICPVTLFVLGHYPKKIHIKQLS